MRNWWCLKDVRNRLVFCCCWIEPCCCCWCGLCTPLAPPIEPISMEEHGDDDDVSINPAPSTDMNESSSLSFIKLTCMSDDEDLMLGCIRRLVRTRWFFNEDAGETEAGELW